MEEEFRKILICPNCHDVWKNDNRVYQHEDNGIRYSCNRCDGENYYDIGLIVIGSDAVADALQALEGKI